MYIILLNLQVIFFFHYSIIECFKKVYIYCLVINNIIVYYISIILHILNNITNCIELEIVKD